MQSRPDHPESWHLCRPYIIAHDVARSRDHSTAVIGGLSPYQPPLIGVVEARELPQQLYGSARASALAAADRDYQSNALIVADLSYDPSYAAPLFQTFGRRLIGLQISRYGDGQQPERRPVGDGVMLVYTIGRSYLLELLQAQLVESQVRFAQNAGVLKAYEQLTRLEVEYRQTGTVYSCPPGQHDDLGISLAMLIWAAKHPYLKYWARALEPRVRKPKPKVSWEAWT